MLEIARGAKSVRLLARMMTSTWSKGEACEYQVQDPEPSCPWFEDEIIDRQENGLDERPNAGVDHQNHQERCNPWMMSRRSCSSTRR